VRERPIVFGSVENRTATAIYVLVTYYLLSTLLSVLVAFRRIPQPTSGTYLANLMRPASQSTLCDAATHNNPGDVVAVSG
jgi:hypothetical protein